MGEEETERVWLVERSYGSDEDLVTLVYATPDGTRHLRKQLSHSLVRRTTVTAARRVDEERLESVDDEETHTRYADEVERVRANYDPDDPV